MRKREHCGRFVESVVSAACLVRGLPLFFSPVPRTPLRALGIVAFDTLHVLRRWERLPRKRVQELAVFLDLQGCANAAWDHKGACDAEYLTLRDALDTAGLRSVVEQYLDRLRDVESVRPSIGGDRRRFEDVRSYREAVARLSIETAAGIALNRAGSRCAGFDTDVDTLFRILMQCQIIDDVLDYTDDLAAGLPSFLTASASLPQAMALTAEAARSYGASRARSRDSAFPLRLALGVFTVVTKLVVRVAQQRPVVRASPSLTVMSPRVPRPWPGRRVGPADGGHEI